MIAEVKAKGQAFNVVTVTDCVQAALRDLGYETRTYGPLNHEIAGYFATQAFRVFGSNF